MHANPKVKREIVRITGNVQGVGFRYHVRDTAKRFSVAGGVRNVRARSAVEIDVEGSSEEVDCFLEAVLAEPPGRVHNVAHMNAEPRYALSFDILPTIDEYSFADPAIAPEE